MIGGEGDAAALAQGEALAAQRRAQEGQADTGSDGITAGEGLKLVAVGLLFYYLGDKTGKLLFPRGKR